jgi:hypothetical protein
LFLSGFILHDIAIAPVGGHVELITVANSHYHSLFSHAGIGSDNAISQH